MPDIMSVRFNEFSGVIINFLSLRRKKCPTALCDAPNGYVE